MSGRLITHAWVVLLAAGVVAACASDQSATTPAGPRFLPARGWHTAATGTRTEPPIVPSAIAANFRVTVPPGRFPSSSDLPRIPAKGVVITLSVWPSTHGFDLRAHPIRALPLRFSDSHLGRRFDAVPAAARWYALAARVHGHIVEVDVFVNRLTPTRAVRRLIQSELDRIVIPH
jgi:hypothetical protein